MRIPLSEGKPRSEIRSFGTGEIDLQSVKSAARVKFAALRRVSGPAAGIVMGKGGALPSSLPLCGEDFTFRFAEDFTRINGFHFFAQQKNFTLEFIASSDKFQFVPLSRKYP